MPDQRDPMETQDNPDKAHRAADRAHQVHQDLQVSTS